MLVVYFAVSALLLVSGFLFPPSKEFVDSVPVMLSIGLLLPIFLWYRKYGLKRALSGQVNGRGKSAVAFWILALFALAMIVRFPFVVAFRVPYEKTPLVYLLILTMAFVEKTRVSAFGLKTEGFNKALLCGVAYFGVFSFLPGLILALIAYGFLGQLLIQAFDFSSFFLAMPFMTLCVGLSEESLFRGYMQTHLERFYSKRRANLLQALLFGVWHVVWYVSTPRLYYIFGYVTVTFIVGLFYGYFYSKARNILPLIIAHGLHNSFLLGLQMNQNALEVLGGLPPLNQMIIWVMPYILSGTLTYVFTKYAVKEL
jgi:membrane protease YdiL (CAAX protease family)